MTEKPRTWTIIHSNVGSTGAALERITGPPTGLTHIEPVRVIELEPVLDLLESLVSEVESGEIRGGPLVEEWEKTPDWSGNIAKALLREHDRLPNQ